MFTMDKTAFLILSLWAAGLVKCDMSLNECHFSERRHHVQVVYESSAETKKCAGTLIHKQWVITAKDCYGGIDGTLKVKLSDKKTILVIKSSDVMSTSNEPILLLKLPKSVSSIKPALLPSGNCMTPEEGDELQVSGYSFTKTEGDVNTNLMCLDVQVSNCADLPETDTAKYKRVFCGKKSEDISGQNDYGSGFLVKKLKKRKITRKVKQIDTLFGVLIDAQPNQLIFYSICHQETKNWLDGTLKPKRFRLL
ncbi:hypothetical protein SRHO_G00233710 [Serrasalmus rhombeus]